MTESRPKLLEVHVSVPDADTGQRIANALITGRTAACVQILGPMTSVYAWEGQVERATEWLLLVKATGDVFDDLCRAVRSLHPYAVPEIVALPVSNALGDYAQWVWETTGPQREANSTADQPRS